jgi:hypothetical protein
MPVHGRQSVYSLGSALVAALVMASCLAAQERGENQPRPFPSRDSGPPPLPRGDEPRRFDEPLVANTTKGFVFLDGEYVPPPYEIREGENEVSINGQKLTCQPMRPVYGYGGYGGRGFGYGGGEGRGGGGPGGGPRGWVPGSSGPGGFGGGRNSDPWRSMVGEIVQQLSADSIVMSFADQPLVVFGSSGPTYDLLKALTSDDSDATDGKSKAVIPVSFLDKLPDGFDPAVWDEWISGYVSPADLRRRAHTLIASSDASEKEAKIAIAATKRLNAWAYPLTLGMMVVTVLAVGHLLGGRPHAGKSTAGIDDSPEMLRALNWSLIFVVLLSLLDLTWTILVGQAGQMRELNPVGSHLLQDPRQLAGFKIGATLPSLGLLWLLRRHKRAQVAAWWICLILVFVAFRWVTVNSAYVAA